MRSFNKITLYLIPVVLLLSALLHVMLPAEADKGWLLHVARMGLEGRKLYVGIIEVNPPLIVWLYTIPVWISMHVNGLQDFEALGLIGLAFSLMSVAVCECLIRLHPAFAGNVRDQVRFMVLLLLVIIFYTTQIYFFDRDHIFLVFTLPYMLRFMPSLAERKLPLWLRCAVGCMGAVGFCIKPHTIIVFIILQLFAIRHTRSISVLWRLENCIIAAGGLLYLLCIWHFTPEYLSVIMPMALATYSQFGNKSTGYIYLPPAVVSAGLIFADFRVWYVTPYRRDVYYFMMICVAFLVYAMAQNGWGYTYNPLYCVLLLTTGWMMWEYTWLKRDHEERGLPAKRFNFGMRGCYIVFLMQAMYMAAYLVVMLFSLDTIRSPCEGQKDCWQAGPYVQYLRKHEVHSFGTISLDFSNWVLLMRLTGAQWDTRFNHLWMMPKLVKSSPADAAKNRWILEFVAKGYAQDLQERKPQLILVDSSPGFAGHSPPVNFLAVLGVVPAFKEAWRHYQYAETLGICSTHLGSDVVASECRYDAYVRIP